MQGLFSHWTVSTDSSTQVLVCVVREIHSNVSHVWFAEIYSCSHIIRCHETPHRPHRRQIQVLGIGNMCLVQCILLISIKKRNRLRFSCISDLYFLPLLLIQCKISLYLGPVRCFVTPHIIIFTAQHIVIVILFLNNLYFVNMFAAAYSVWVKSILIYILRFSHILSLIFNDVWYFLGYGTCQPNIDKLCWSTFVGCVSSAQVLLSKVKYFLEAS